jgi:GAF domain-containing protein
MSFESLKTNNVGLLATVNALIDEDLPLVSNLANLSRALFDGFDSVSWAGFYLTSNSGDKLYLGPYQGPLACTTIPFNKGVCGYSATNKQTVLVKDVNNFEGHIACSSLTKSELVTPIIKDGEVVGVIDLDSNLLANFTDKDASLLQEVAKIIAKLFK